ncbi:MAG: DUF4251 domain-containing protein [Pricia sp.]
MLKFKFEFLVCFCLLVILSCGGTSKTVGEDNGNERLEEFISEKSFEIISDRAFPMATNALNSIANAGLLPPGSTAGQITLIGNSNYLRVIGDSVSVYLPYYGERQMGGGYNNDGPGIQFEGVPTEMEITKNNDKKRYDIRFQMKDDSELFTVNVSLFPNLSSVININSSQRFPIRYSGNVRPVPSDPR